MDASIGVNLRVTAHSNQGGRKYMEDMFCVAYQPTADEKDLLYAYFGIFDGHGGREAALYAKTHLMDHIVSQKNFWSEDDDLVLRSIRDGFISVHQAMWRELDKWPKTQSGLPSTSGTTASVAFVRRGKLYIGHVGDSGIVLGSQDPNSNFWKAKPLTMDHKPENPVENARIQECGGKVVSKSGVPRVVWNRPRLGHKGPVRRSTLIDEIPFLAVARSLGDLWSYNSEQNEFVVSPVPDTTVIEIDVNTHRCLILGSDGLWNMLSAQDAVNSVYFAEKNNERQNQLAAQLAQEGTPSQKNWINPSKRLVDRALDRWYSHNLRADNTSVVTVVIDPPGPPRVQKPPSPRASSSSLSPERSSPVSRLSCAQTNNHGVSPSSRFQRAIATTRFANNDKHSPPRVHSPSYHHHHNHHPQPQQPESSQQGKVSGAKSTATSSLSKLKAATSATSNLHRSRQQQQARDPPTRGTRSHPILSSKTSRVVHVRSPTASTSSAPPPAPPPAAASTSVAHEDVDSDSDNVSSGRESDDQVQINEISSSCEESWRTDSSDLDESIQASSIQVKETKKQRRGTKRVQPRTAASTSRAAAARKRASRQSAAETGEDGCSTVSPSKVIRLAADEGRSSSSSSRTRSESHAENELHTTVSKLRNRMKDIRYVHLAEAKKSTSSPAAAEPEQSVSSKKKKGKNLRKGKAGSQPSSSKSTSSELPPTPSRVKPETFNVTKKSLRAIPILPEVTSVVDGHVLKTAAAGVSPSNRSSVSRKSSPSGVKPLNQKNARAPVFVELDGARSTAEPPRNISPRVLPLRTAAVNASLYNTIALTSVTLKKSKPELKRLQQGKEGRKSPVSPSKRESRKKDATEKKSKAVSARPSKDTEKSGDGSEGRSLRSGSVPPRVTRSRNRI